MRALALQTSDIVATGVQRAVYLHPFDSSKLIKVLRPAATRPRRTNFNGIMDRLLPSTRVRQIRKEYAEYMRVMLNHPNADFHAPIAHMFGFTPTTEGLGCITERVMRRDGQIGETLGAKATAGTLTQADIALLNDTIARIYAHDIRASDMKPNNFVFGQRHYGSDLGPEECVLVDGFGDIHAIPVRSMGRWSNRMGLDDSCARLARNTGLDWDPQDRQFALPRQAAWMPARHGL
ncbi:YrbL family protein [Yoonia vestfoldensis]|uniref:YrbL family protein n=1 Tax=Yoonia vestfoldensis TaxID=245188 RepID=UPI00037B9BAE|nr:YrbL family protein [Yoonia vestfoldensis]